MSSTAEAFWWTLTGWFIVAACGFAFAAGIVDGSGRKPNNHVGPIPSGVAQLSDSAYLVQDNTLSPTDVCGNEDDSHGGVDSTSAVDQMPGTLYIQCENEITWNDDRPGSTNYAGAMVEVGTSPFFLIPAGGLLLLLQGIPLNEYRAARRRRRYRRADNEDKRLALAEAYAHGKITDREFEIGLERFINDV